MQPWKGGVLTLDPVVERLRQLLPATFEELPVPLAVGVVDQFGKHVLIRSGPLPEAVAASAAIPMIFSAVDIPGALTHIAHILVVQGGVLCHCCNHANRCNILMQVLLLDRTLMAVRLTALH